MERKNQNLELIKNTKSEDYLERRTHKLFAVVRPVRASGGDIVAQTRRQYNSKNSSYQDIREMRINVSEADEDAELEDEEKHKRHKRHEKRKSETAVLQRERISKSSEPDRCAKPESRYIKRERSSACNVNRSAKSSGQHKLTSKRKSSTTATVGSSSRTSETSCRLNSELCKYKEELKAYNNTTKDLEEKYLKINCELNAMQEQHDHFVAKHKQARELDIYSDTTSSSSSEFALKRKYTQVFHRGSSFMTMLSPETRSSTEHVQNTNTATTTDTTAYATNELVMCKKHKRPQTSPQPSVGDFTTIRHTCTVPVIMVPQKKKSKRKMDANKENDPPSGQSATIAAAAVAAASYSREQTSGLKDIYQVLKSVLDNNSNKMPPSNPNSNVDTRELQATIASLQNEQAQFRSIIQQQQYCLQDYHSRCLKAQQVMKTQHDQIQKLNSNNQQLESEIYSGIDQLRSKIDLKLRDVSHLPQLVREEQCKFEKINKENNLMTDRMRMLQSEASQLKLKVEELGRRKSVTINRLKTAERDLKIFKNYNTALKHEKRKLCEELQKVKEQLDAIQNTSKRTLARQREQTEKQRRELQKRVFELELKLSRSQNSTTGLIQERDSLIAELQTQLNTLVHNFEVSQKHIRVLRRHIYTMSGGNSAGINNNRILEDNM